MITKSVAHARPSRRELRLLVDTIEERERSRRQRVWEIRKEAASSYFGPSVLVAGGWAIAFQTTFKKIIDDGRDFTAIPRYDDLAKTVAGQFPEYDADDGTERLWDFLLSPHNPMPTRAQMRQEALELLGHGRLSVPEVEDDTPDAKPVVEVSILLPGCFQTIFDLASCRRNILLVGPAGCGKSHVSKLVADQLGLKFGAVNCTSGMSEAHLLGRSMPNLTTGESVFEGTAFLDCYENGGVFLMDEIDAADPNLLLAINTAIANGYCNVPSRTAKPRAERHPDFVLIATANTYGRGATRSYAGRNQLDEATLDRFRIGTVEMDYDPTVERAVCPDETLRGRLQKLRERIRQSGLRRILSTRFMGDAYVMHTSCAWGWDRLLEAFFQGWSVEERSKVEG